LLELNGSLFQIVNQFTPFDKFTKLYELRFWSTPRKPVTGFE